MNYNETEYLTDVVPMPICIWIDKDLSPTEKIILTDIIGLIKKYGKCFKSNAAFSKILSLSENRVSKIISGLQKKGYLVIIYDKSASNNVEKRHIMLSETLINSLIGGIGENDKGGIGENAKDKRSYYKRSNEEEIESKDSISAKLFSDLPQPKKKKQFIPPTQAEVIEYFLANGYREDAAKKAFLYYDSADWKDSRGNQVKNWKQKMNGNWFRPENEGKKQNSSDQIKMVY
jgi:hypothetical protein